MMGPGFSGKLQAGDDPPFEIAARKSLHASGESTSLAASGNATVPAR